jgi:hypothetical protein
VHCIPKNENGFFAGCHHGMYRVDRYSSDKISSHSAYNKKVSDEMQTSINKIRTYIKSIYKKIKVKSNVEISNIYLRSR